MSGSKTASAVHTGCRFVRLTAWFYATGVVLPGLVTPLAGIVL